VKIAAVILAAGGSTRMGSPKQLLLFEGRTLLQRAVDTAAALPVLEITVVLGANVELIKPVPRYSHAPGTSHQNAQVAINPDWNLGMGSSIRVGVAETLDRHSDLDAILITLCDQPRVDAAALSKLLSRVEQGDCPAVAAGYSETVGVPAVFGRSSFDALLNLKPAGGAKSILTGPGVAVVPMPEAVIDVDTPDDFALLNQDV
jgi:molybdenum cofactor cytidylyltransferase